MKIAIGSDHVVYELKGKVIAHLKEKGIEVKDFGTNSTERTDYPIYGEAVANAVASRNLTRVYLYAVQVLVFLLRQIRLTVSER